MIEDVLKTPGHLISVAARGFVRLSESRLRPIGLGAGYIPVLVSLLEEKANTQRDLARLLKIEQPPMAQTLGRMERDGLIVRTPNPTDKRQQIISLTAAAKDRIPEALDMLFDGNEEAFAGITKKERLHFVALLQQVIENLDELNRPEQ